MGDIANSLKKCAESYKKLVDSKVRYSIEYFLEDNKSICEISFSFTPKEFKHLTGIGKLKDITESSTVIYEKSNGLCKKSDGTIFTSENIEIEIEESEYFFDDVKRKAELSEEDYETEAKSEEDKKHFFKSKMLERMSALEHFYDTMQQMQLNGTSSVTLNMYKWLREECKKDEKPKNSNYYSSKRPRNSTINADYLIEFHDSGASPKSYVDFFIISDKNTEPFSGVSIFRQEFTYSDDTPDYKKGNPKAVSRALESNIVILSVTKTMIENEKEITETKSAEKSVIEKCKRLAEEKRAKDEERAARIIPHADEDKKVKKLFDTLKHNRNCKNDKIKFEYDKTLKLLFKESDYTLEKLKDNLKISSGSKNNEKFREQMEKEIRLIDSLLKERQLISDLASIKEKLTQENFFGRVDEYKIIANRIIAEAKKSDMKPILCQNILAMLKEQNIECSDETVSQLLSEEVENKLLHNLESMAEEAGSSSIITANQTFNEFHNANPDGTAVITPFDNLKQNLLETGRRIKEYIDKGKGFLKEKVESVINLFRKKNDDAKPDDTEPPTEQDSSTDSVSSEKKSEPEQVQTKLENVQEQSGRYVYNITDEFGISGFCQRDDGGYSSIVPDTKSSNGLIIDFSKEKWGRMIPQKDVVQSGQEQQYSDNQEQEGNHGKSKYEIDR